MVPLLPEWPFAWWWKEELEVASAASAAVLLLQVLVAAWQWQLGYEWLLLASVPWELVVVEHVHVADGSSVGVACRHGWHGHGNGDGAGDAQHEPKDDQHVVQEPKGHGLQDAQSALVARQRTG